MSRRLAATAQRAHDSCVLGLRPRKRPSQPPAGAQTSSGTTTQHTLSRQDFASVPPKQAFILCPQLLEHFRGAQHPLEACGCPLPWALPSSRILTPQVCSGPENVPLSRFPGDGAVPASGPHVE